MYFSHPSVSVMLHRLFGTFCMPFLCWAPFEQHFGPTDYQLTQTSGVIFYIARNLNLGETREKKRLSVHHGRNNNNQKRKTSNNQAAQAKSQTLSSAERARKSAPTAHPQQRKQSHRTALIYMHQNKDTTCTQKVDRSA